MSLFSSSSSPSQSPSPSPSSASDRALPADDDDDDDDHDHDHDGNSRADGCSSDPAAAADPSSFPSPHPTTSSAAGPESVRSCAAAASKLATATPWAPSSPLQPPVPLSLAVPRTISEPSQSPLASMTCVVPLSLLKEALTPPRSPVETQALAFESLQAIGKPPHPQEAKVPVISVDSPVDAAGGSLSMTLNGVRLSYVLDFVKACGGRHGLHGLTTANVSQRWIVPQTASCKLSAVDHLLLHGRTDVVSPANWFISHAWSFCFLDVVDALVSFFKAHHVDPHDAVIWFDMFSNSQHDTSARPFDWWKETFMAAVKSIQNVVMVLLPWNDPVPLTRAWCVFEVFATAYTKSKFHVAMPPSVSSDFFSNLVGRPSIFYEVLAKISCTRSCATLESDRKLIFEVIDCSLPDGMAALDALVLNVFGQWLTKMIKTYHDRAMAAVADLEQGATGTVPSIPSVTLSATADSASSTDKSTEASKPAPVTNARDVAMLEAAQWSYTLARLYDDQGDHQLAEPLYVFCVDTRVSVLGQLHPSTLLAMFRRHDNLSYLGRRTEALALAQECLALREQAGCPEQDILSSKNSIANALLFLGKIKKATKLHEEILEGRTKALGESSPETLRSMNNLANAYKQLPEVEKAEHLFSQCYKLRVQYLGENHPDTLKSLYNLAEFRRHAHRYDTVEEILDLLENSYQKRRAVLGEAHPDTLNSLSKLANTHQFEQRDPGAAVALLTLGLSRVATAAGRTSLPALQIKEALAAALAAAGDSAAADQTYRECRDTLRARFDDLATTPRDAAAAAAELRRVENAMARKESRLDQDYCGSLHPGGRGGGRGGDGARSRSRGPGHAPTGDGRGKSGSRTGVGSRNPSMNREANASRGGGGRRGGGGK